MSKEDYEIREARRKAEEEKYHAGNEVHRKAMDKKAEFHAKERQKNMKAFEKGCFVATAAFGDHNASEVIYLSAFRDDFLNQRDWGRMLIHVYYLISPQFAAIINKSDTFRLAVRKLVLRPMIYLLRQVRR